MKPEPDPFEYEEESTETVADDLLVHALLVGRFQDTPQAMQSRVERVCRDFQPAPRTTWRFWRASLSTAAAAVVVVGLILIFSVPQDVQADLGQVLQAFDAGDRTYQIEIGDSFGSMRRSGGPGRRRQGRQQQQRPAGRAIAPRRLDGAHLYTRRRQYVLVCTTPTGREVAKGFDGQRSWLTGPWQQPRFGNDPNLLHKDLPDDIASLLFLDLRDILHQIRPNYRLHELADAEAPSGKIPLRHFVALRRGRRWALPQRIELWFAPETGQLEQIVCTEAGPRGRRRPRLRISLVNTDPLPADWFSPEAHLPEPPTP